MKIHATTLKIAKTANLDLEANEKLCGNNDVLDVWLNLDICEGQEFGCLVSYIINNDGSYTFRQSQYPELGTELPAHINDEKHLRAVLKFIGSEIPTLAHNWARDVHNYDDYGLCFDCDKPA